ncbi:MAG: hypothetical protein VYC34_12505, partial [Planctomycetota bacterium]|nr:hypothetical protein [Planctomycetota bacterium]
LLLLLPWLLRRIEASDRFRKLSLLAKCLLASLLVHMLLMFALTVWKVSTAIEGFFDRPGGTQVHLTTSGSMDAVTAQVRGGASAVELDPARPTTTAAATPVAPSAPPELLTAAPERVTSALRPTARSDSAEDITPDRSEPEAPASRLETTPQSVEASLPNEAAPSTSAEQSVTMQSRSIEVSAAREVAPIAPSPTEIIESAPTNVRAAIEPARTEMESQDAAPSPIARPAPPEPTAIAIHPVDALRVETPSDEATTATEQRQAGVTARSLASAAAAPARIESSDEPAPLQTTDPVALRADIAPSAVEISADESTPNEMQSIAPRSESALTAAIPPPSSIDALRLPSSDSAAIAEESESIAPARQRLAPALAETTVAQQGVADVAPLEAAPSPSASAILPSAFTSTLADATDAPALPRAD